MPPSPSKKYAARLKRIVQSVQPLPDAAKAPILHFRRTVADIWGSLAYVERLIAEREGYQAVVNRHLGRLYGMAMVNLIETFERFLKELAAECVDHLADLVMDDRFNAFAIQGAAVASHFGSGSIGRALCESSIWLDCKEINDRFRKLLADPHETGTFYLFPKAGQNPISETWRYELMTLIWQIRHTYVHNVGVITKSDAVKLRVLGSMDVVAPRMLSPTRNDIYWLKTFLDDTMDVCNQRIGMRLSDLLSTIHVDNPGLNMQPKTLADSLSAVFRYPVVIGGITGTVPLD